MDDMEHAAAELEQGDTRTSLVLERAVLTSAEGFCLEAKGMQSASDRERLVYLANQADELCGVLAKYEEDTTRADARSKKGSWASNLNLVRSLSSARTIRLSTAQVEGMLVALSTLYTELRAARLRLGVHSTDEEVAAKAAQLAAEDAEGSTVLSRSTEKFFVKPGYLLRAKLEILKHLPLYVHKEDPRRAGDTPPPVTVSTPINSVYLDTDDLLVYQRRSDKERNPGNSQCIRLRWYPPSSPEDASCPIWIEQKTHCVKWIQGKSTKERYPIKSRYVAGLLKGQPPPDTHLRQMGQGIKLTPKEIEHGKEYLQQVASKIASEKQHVAIRTHYLRTAFQPSKDDRSVRISLDEDLCMTDESTWAKQNVIRVDAPPHQGSSTQLPLESLWCTPSGPDLTKKQKEALFKFAVLEVKLQHSEGSESEGPPEWLAALTAQEDLLIAMPKFSKFLQGSASTPHNKETILAVGAELPPWWNNKEDAAVPPPDPTVSSCVPAGVGPLSCFPELPVLHSPMKMKQRADPARDRNLGPAPYKVPERKPRVEPKTYFANERTFLQWLSISVLIIFIAFMMLEIDGARPGVGPGPMGVNSDGFNKSVQGFEVAGSIFAVIGILCMLYSLVMYLWRNKQISALSKVNYHDNVGPTILVLVLVAASLTVMAAMHIEHHHGSVSDPAAGPLFVTRDIVLNGSVYKLDTSAPPLDMSARP